MIPLRSRSDSFTFTPELSAIASGSNFSRCPLNLERSLAFYEGVLGLKVTKRIGDEAAFLAYEGYHHDICINTWQSRDGSPPAQNTTGLFHLAIVYAERSGLPACARRFGRCGKRTQPDEVRNSAFTRASTDDREL
jgi:catechol-2,3-dioxygenase